MSRKKFVGLILTVALCLTLVLTIAIRLNSGRGGSANLSLNKAHTDTVSDSFAYITERQFVLMKGNQTLARVARFFPSFDPYQNKVIWTNDGSYVAFLKNVTLLDQDPSTEQLIIVNARSGAIRRIHCPRCYDLTPVGNQSVLTAADARDGSNIPTFVEFNPSSAKTERVQLGLGDTGSSVGQFLASTRNLVLSSHGGYADGEYVQYLKLTNLGNHSHINLGYFPSNDAMLAAASNVSGASTTFAVAFRPNPGECVADFPIYIFGPGTSVRETDISNAEPPGGTQGVDEGLQVNDLWWGADGHFHATIESWLCNNSKRAENDKQIPVSPSLPWKLDGNKWIKDGTYHTTMVRQLSGNTFMTLVIPECIGPVKRRDISTYCNKGKLYRDQRGKISAVATGVISILSPSPRTLPSAIPTLGQLAGVFAHGTGFGEVKPAKIFNGGDPTGLVSHVKWKSWGSPHAIGTGVAEWVGPSQTVVSGKEEPTTVVAFNLGKCNGQLMYRAVEWYFPQHGQAFNPHQYENICTGTYMSSP